jgi:hypothetical protein
LGVFSVLGGDWFLGSYGFEHLTHSQANRLRLQMFSNLLVLPFSFYQQDFKPALTAKLLYNTE